MTAPADTLRQAATLMRERAEKATPGPWTRPVANVFRIIAPDAPHSNAPSGRTPPYPWRPHHLPENCADENLRAMCQRCHLSYDAEHHAQTAARTRREAIEAAGQGTLL